MQEEEEEKDEEEEEEEEEDKRRTREQIHSIHQLRLLLSHSSANCKHKEIRFSASLGFYIELTEGYYYSKSIENEENKLAHRDSNQRLTVIARFASNNSLQQKFSQISPSNPIA